MFAYCGNNPIVRVDYNGNYWNLIVGGVIGLVAGGGIAVLSNEDLAGIIVASVAGGISGVVAASGLGLLAQAGISAGISSGADIANQIIDIIQQNGNLSDFNIKQNLGAALAGFVSSAVGTAIGTVVDKTITKTLAKSTELYDKYLEKVFTAELRKEVGKSSSALIRQANNFLKQSDLYLNASRAISSVTGSILSFLNLAEEE